MLLAGETHFLTGISNINIFFIKKNMHVIVFKNIHDKFATTNLTLVGLGCRNYIKTCWGGGGIFPPIKEIKYC